MCKKICVYVIVAFLGGERKVMNLVLMTVSTEEAILISVSKQELKDYLFSSVENVKKCKVLRLVERQWYKHQARFLYRFQGVTNL